MDSDVLNPLATVTIGMRGLAVFCYNEAFVGGNGVAGRWEIAIPRFRDHELLMDIPGFGVVTVGPEVKRIEIAARVLVPPASPKFQVDPFNRNNKSTSNPMDYRWITDITNNIDIPHGALTMKTKAQFPDRVAVTMLYVYGAVSYTKEPEDHVLVLGTHANTCPVVKGVPKPLSIPQAGVALDAIANPYGFSAVTVGMDIESEEGGVVDMTMNGSLGLSFPQANGLQRISVSNLEPQGTAAAPNAIVETGSFIYGRGDFFRYYELFEAAGSDRFHLWEKSPKQVPAASPLTSLPEGDCNPTGGNFANLNDLASESDTNGTQQTEAKIQDNT